MEFFFGGGKQCFGMCALLGCIYSTVMTDGKEREEEQGEAEREDVTEVISQTQTQNVTK